MHINLRALVAKIRSSFGTKQNRGQSVPPSVKSGRPRSFRPALEMLEDRIFPSISAGQGMQVYQTLLDTADHIEIAVANAAQGLLTNSQPLTQAIGPAFLQGVASQLETDLAPLITANFAAAPGDIFSAGNGVEFGQKASNFIRDCLHRKIFARCATQAADGGAAIAVDFGNPIVFADLPGAIVYATAYTRICDEIYIREIAPCVEEFSCDVYDGDAPDFEDAPLEIQDCVSAGASLVPPIVQSGEQSIEQFNADPGSAAGASQTPTLQFENADGSAASSTTFDLSATGAAQSSNSSIFDAFGALIADVQSTYAANGLVGSQDVTFFDALGSIAGAYASTSVGDGSSITVQSLFNADGLVGSQDVTLYKPDGAISISVTTIDTEAADKSLMTTEGTVTDGSAQIVNTFSLTNTESADGILAGNTNSTSDANGSADVSATVDYDAEGQSLIVLTATDFVNDVPSGVTTIDSNGDPVATGGGDSGGGGGDTSGGDTGGGDIGGGDTGSGDIGGGGDTGGVDTGGGDTGSGDFGGGDTSSGDVSGGDTGSGDTGGDFGFAPMAARAMIAAPTHAYAAVAPAAPFAGVIASFTDTDPNPADYSAIILWGDGTGSAGVVSAAGFGQFKVLGTHASAPAVNSPMFVSVTNVVNGKQILAAQPTTLPFSDAFDGLQLSDSWATEGGNYVVVNNQATALMLNEANVAVLKGVSAADVSVSVGVTNLLAGVTAALVARYQGAGNLGLASKTNFYYGSITHTGNAYSAAIYKNLGGVSTLLASSPVSVSQFDGTGTLTFELQGAMLRLIATNGGGVPSVVALVSDSAITNPGTVGLWGSIAAQFDHFSAKLATLTNPSISPSFTDLFAATPDGQLSSDWVDKVGDFACNPSGGVSAISMATANLAVLNGVAAANVAESVMVTNLHSGQMAGLVARYQGPGDANFYFGAINRAGNAFTARIYKNIKGVWKIIASAPVPRALFKGTGAIQFEAEGPSLRLFIANGHGALVPIVLAWDTSITKPGSVGIRGSGGTQFRHYSANAVTLTTPSIAPSFTDTFGATPDGQLNGNWLNPTGNFSVSNGAANGQVAGRNLAVLIGVRATDVNVQANIDLKRLGLVAGAYAGLVARSAGPRNSNLYMGFVVRLGNGRLQPYIERSLGGVVTVLSTGATIPNTAGTLRFQVQGSSLKLFLNGKLISHAHDTVLKSGSTGMVASQGVSEKIFHTGAIVAPA